MSFESLAWAEVDLDAVAWNVHVIRNQLARGVRLLAAVKSNGYGHGAAEIARTCVRHGVQALGVARLQEGITLREAGIVAPVLILGPTPEDGVAELLHYGLTPTVTGIDDARRMNARIPEGGNQPVHVKLDTGMGRLGCLAQPGLDGVLPHPEAQRIAQEIAAIAALPRLSLQGVFTHFACADGVDAAPTQGQFRAFQAVLGALHEAGVHHPVRHAANSPGIFYHPETHLDMVRAGIAIYGYGAPQEAGLRPVMTLKTRIVQLRRVPANTSVSYGMTYRTTAPTTLATIALGYGDGYSRAHSSRGQMLVRGCLAPVVGRVCMDLTMLDVSHIPDVAEGDEVVAFGRQGNAERSADALAESIGTISHEVLTTLTPRVRRVYKSETNTLATEKAL